MTAATMFAARSITDQAAMSITIAAWIRRAAAFVKGFGPYAAIELILPGGSIVALVLWLYRRHQKEASESRSQARSRTAITPARRRHASCPGAVFTRGGPAATCS